MSRIGKKPVAIPKGVTVAVKDGSLSIQGPKGTLKRTVSARVTIDVKDSQVIVNRVSDTKADRALHGLFRALIANMIKGVTDGYTKEMEIIGTGFRAQMQGKNLIMQLGFSHPVNIQPPDDITITAPKQTQVIITGIDKEKVGEIAAQIRKVYPPEPYKGKGIRFAGEIVKKKVGKAQASTK
jgi:large subunit ribosomal protein L6